MLFRSPAAPVKRLKLVLGGEYGYGFGTRTQFRLAGIVGVRLWDSTEVDLLAGLLSSERILGVENRIFFNRGPARLFSRAAFTWGSYSGNDSITTTAIEAGLGGLWGGLWAVQSTISLRVAFYGEDPMPSSDDPDEETGYTLIWAFGLLLN